MGFSIWLILQTSDLDYQLKTRQFSAGSKNFDQFSDMSTQISVDLVLRNKVIFR